MTKQLNSHEVKALLKKACIHQINGEMEEAERIVNRVRAEASPRTKLEVALRYAELIASVKPVAQ